MDTMLLLALGAIIATPFVIYSCVKLITNAYKNSADKRFEEYKSQLSSREDALSSREAELNKRSEFMTSLVAKFSEEKRQFYEEKRSHLSEYEAFSELRDIKDKRQALRYHKSMYNKELADEHNSLSPQLSSIIERIHQLEQKEIAYKKTIEELSAEEKNLRSVVKDLSRDAIDALHNAVGVSIPVDHTDCLHSVRSATNVLREKIVEYQALSAEVEKRISVLEEKCNSFTQTSPWLATMVSEFLIASDASGLRSIETRGNASISTVAELRKSLAEKKHYIQLYKQSQYQLSVYESVFPFLQEFSELSSEEIGKMIHSDLSDKPDYDRVRDWLSKEEYASLDPNTREMMALERYKNRKKTNWEIGVEYEQYVGYQCERRGYHVQYTGATQGLEDMGRDLVITTDGGMKSIIIQCKRWSLTKTIHEKHIFQLYGTVVTKAIKENIPYVVGVFVTTATLSQLAKDCAKALGIHVVENYPMADFPRIKCNIGRNGEKIYHMPYDQQYNSIVISREKGEFYTFTNEEAQSRGFRRAWRWHGS